MTCNVDPREIEKSEDKKASVFKYTMDIKDDKKLISCIVNNQAFGGDFYNNFILPLEVGANYKDGTGHPISVHLN